MIAYTAFGCTDTTRDTVTVFPIPTLSFTSDAVVDCGPVTVNFTNTTLGDSLNYFWNFGDGTTVVNDTNPTHIFQNNTLFINNYQVQQVVASQDGCRDTTTRTVQIYPEPIFTFLSVPDSGCSPLSVTFPSVVGAVDYQWDFGDGSTATGPTPSHIYVNSTTNNQNYVVRLIAQSSFGCLDTTFGNVLVFPNPTSNFSIDTNKGCQPLPIIVTNNSTGSNNFRWDFGDGTNSTNGNANFVKTYVNTSAITEFNDIRLITETVNGCRDTFQRTVEVHPFIQAAFTSNDTGCSPLNVSFVNQSFGAQSFMWKFGDGATSPVVSPSHTYTNTTNANESLLAELIAISAKGCLDTAGRNILIYPKPQAVFSADVTSGCEPLEVTFTQSSNLADNCILSYGDLDTFKLCGPTSIHTFLNPNSFFQVTYNSELTVTTVNGCTDTQVIPITVNPRLIADYSSIDSGCSPLTVSFSNQSTGSNSHIWTYGDGANSFSQSPTHTYINPTTQNQMYNAQLVAVSQFNCTDTMRKDITVFGKPIATVVPNNSTGCHPLVVNFNNQSQGQDSCNWAFGDGFGLVDSCGVNVAHTFDNLLSSAPISRQTFLYVYTDEGCSDTANQIITINPNVEAVFSAPTEGCSPFEVNFGNQSTGAPVYNWTFGDGGTSTTSDPGHTFIYLGQSDTTFTTNLRASNNFGCFDDSQIVITVNPKPIADYSINTNESCQPVDITFTNNSSLRDSCSWIFGDGASDLNNCQPNLIHTYINRQSLVPLDYLSELRIYTDKGCSDTLTRSIRVKPQVIADFSGDTVACSPFDATFRSQSFGAVNYNWNFGDGAVGSGAVTNHIFTNTGSVDSLYIVTLTASSLFNCDDVFTKTVRVHPTPLVSFTATPLTQEFPDTTVIVTNTTSNGNWSYVWAFGDGKNSQLQNPGSHNYSTWGNYTIQLKASSQNCIDSAEVSILIEAPTPVADFGDSAVGCEPLQVTFKNKTLYGQTYNWDFGDGGRSNSENPTHTYFNAGEYTVTLNVVGFPPGKTDQITKVNYIKVNKEPTADFITSTSKVFIPNDLVVFSNRSRDADSYRWEFGDGNSTSEQSPTYFYTEEGEFRVLLIAYTNEGCVDSTYALTDVIAELEGKVLVPNAFTPNPNGSNGGVVNINPGAGNLNDVFYAKVNGTTKYELNIFNKWGELLFVSEDINIGWDGYYRGKLAQQDSYVWKVTVEFADGTAQVKVGDLLLLR
jgi:PKD repeat protein